MSNSIKKSNILIILVLGILIITCIIFNYIKISSLNKKNVQLEEEIIEEAYDTFTIKIDDINKLINNEIQGYVYIGRETCPICLYFNKYLKNEYNKNNELKIYKFDTDFWRDNEKFKSILNKYNVLSIPTLIKIDSSGDYKIFTCDSENEEDIQTALNNFLYN